MKFRELQEELHELKVQVKQLLYVKDAELQSGESTLSLCLCDIHNMFVQTSLAYLLCLLGFFLFTNADFFSDNIDDQGRKRDTKLYRHNFQTCCSVSPYRSP